MGRLVERHRQEYGKTPEVIASAPGRVNLIGEHTDYNEGFMLPMALELRTYVGVSRRDDLQLRFCSLNTNDRKRTSLPNLRFRREDRWANYPKGIIDVMVKRGLRMHGLELTVNSNVPEGVGLSSSAAMEVAIAHAIAKLFDWRLSPLELAYIARSAENEFVGVQYGIADQFASTFCTRGAALLIDARSLQHRRIPLKLGTCVLLITNSSVPRGLVDSEYSQRRVECEQCVEALKQRKPGRALRDYTADDLRDTIDDVSETTRRRCRHVVEEIQRVQEAVVSLARGDLSSFGKLMNRSHESLRDLYEVSCPEVDWLVKRAWETDGVLGSRMTGAGFGGCTITLLDGGAVEEYRDRVTAYERIFGFKPQFYTAEASDGARIELNK